MSLALAGRFLTTGPPGRSLIVLFTTVTSGPLIAHEFVIPDQDIWNIRWTIRGWFCTCNKRPLTQSSLHAFSWQEEHHKSIPYIITTFLLRGIGLAAEWIHPSLVAGQGSLVAVASLALWAPLEDRVDFRMVCRPCTLLLSSGGWEGAEEEVGVLSWHQPSA